MINICEDIFCKPKQCVVTLYNFDLSGGATRSELRLLSMTRIVLSNMCPRLRYELGSQFREGLDVGVQCELFHLAPLGEGLESLTSAG